MLLEAPTPSSANVVNVARWYAVQTRSRFEKAVRSELEWRRVEHFLATFQEVHQWKDRKRVVETPLFAGYIFVRIEDLSEKRLEVLTAHGVVRVLAVNGAIQPLPDGEIDSIRKLLASGKPCSPHPFVREGAWVRVRRGPLTGVEGRLVGFKGQERLVLSVDLLSRSVATEVNTWDIEPARESRKIAES